MRVIEINRIIKTMEADERISGKTAEWLDLLMGIGSSDRASEDENMVECRNNITRLFPDPIDRARFLRRMVVSIANEDPNDYDEDEGEISNEIVFFLERDA